MLNTIKKSRQCALLFALTFFAFLNSAYADSPKARTSPTGLLYMTGGIGEDQVDDMRPYAKKFTLNLIFSEGTSGRSVTDVNVNIYNETDARIFRIVGAKPRLYVNLPAGNYTILANNNGQKLRHKFTIEGSTNQKIILNWKDTVEEDMPLDGLGN